MDKHSRVYAALLGSLLVAGTMPVACAYNPPLAYDEPIRTRTVAYPDELPDPYADERVGFFHDELAPYGSWGYRGDVGWVWRPGDVGAGWRPYTDGHWIWTDDGWTWVSDREWGWAVFHYGRWGYDELRDEWFWVPGLEWAPAWVAWRQDDDWIGWAPLPPRLDRDALLEPALLEREVVLVPGAYCFVPAGQLLDPGIGHHLIPVYRNLTLIHATRNVTRYVFIDRRVVNRGPDVHEVERIVHHPVPRFVIVDRDTRNNSHGRALRDDEVAMFRPVRRSDRPSPHEERDHERSLRDRSDGSPSRFPIRAPQPSYQDARDSSRGAHDSRGDERVHRDPVRAAPLQGNRPALPSHDERWGDRDERPGDRRTPVQRSEPPRDLPQASHRDAGTAPSKPTEPHRSSGVLDRAAGRPFATREGSPGRSGSAQDPARRNHWLQNVQPAAGGPVRADGTHQSPRDSALSDLRRTPQPTAAPVSQPRFEPPRQNAGTRPGQPRQVREHTPQKSQQTERNARENQPAQSQHDSRRVRNNRDRDTNGREPGRSAR